MKNIYVKAFFATLLWFFMAIYFGLAFYPINIEILSKYHKPILHMIFCVIFGYYSRVWHEIIAKAFPSK